MKKGLRVCRACLIRGESQEAYFKKLDAYIASLDEDLRVEQEVYENRLKICGQCDHLLNGMCRLCGCFVELRAALKVQRCPDIEKKW